MKNFVSCEEILYVGRFQMWSNLRCGDILDAEIFETRPSALGMSDPVMEFLEFHEKGKIFWVRGGRF